MQVPRFFVALAGSAMLSFVSLVSSAAPADGGRGLIELWASGRPAFGQYVTQVAAQDQAHDKAGKEAEKEAAPSPGYTVQTGVDLASNTLLDFAFLSLEQHYEAESARNVATGIRSGAQGKTQLPLLVRIPPISVDGEDAARTRVSELIAMGANGVVIPHVMSADEARTAISFFEGANVWSPSNPQGDVVAMLIIEDPDVFAELDEIVNLPGYSALVCGIGSLTSALGGDRVAAEAINQQVLSETKRVGKPNLTTVDPESVALRVEQGFMGLLAYGPDAQEAIRRGRAAAGR